MVETIPLDQCLNTGDTAWVIISAVLVLGMLPALSFFEAGLLRAKNSLSIMTQILGGLVVLAFLWHVVGFSLVYSDDHGGMIGDFKYMFYIDLGHVCLSHAPNIPGLAFALFQLMFAAITPLLMTGTFAERMRFRSFLIFIIFWEILVYYPLAHWVWGGGWLDKMGVLDFAGGIVIHTSAGFSSLLIAIAMGRRTHFEDYDGEFPPHNVPLATIGASLLWMGWYGFNAGSALAANQVAAYAVTTTTIASAVSAIVWIVLSIIRHHRVHTIAVLNGAIAGLAGITPVSGYIESYWASPIGIAIGLSSYYGIVLIKGKLKIDDALDVSSVHGIPGVVGSLAIGIFASSSVNPGGSDGWIHGHPKLLGLQALGVVIAIVWAGFWTTILLIFLHKVPGLGLKVTPQKEEAGLDIMYHGAVAYNELNYAPSEETEQLINETGQHHALPRRHGGHDLYNPTHPHIIV